MPQIDAGPFAPNPNLVVGLNWRRLGYSGASRCESRCKDECCSKEGLRNSLLQSTHVITMNLPVRSGEISSQFATHLSSDKTQATCGPNHSVPPVDATHIPSHQAQKARCRDENSRVPWPTNNSRRFDDKGCIAHSKFGFCQVTQFSVTMSA